MSRAEPKLRSESAALRKHIAKLRRQIKSQGPRTKERRRPLGEGAPSSASVSVSYAPPTLRGVSVGRGVRRATEGRFEPTLRGANLGGCDTASVTLTNHSGAAKACSITWVAPSHAALCCVAPAFFGDVEVVVSAGGQRSAPVRFAYDPPALWSTAASIDCIDAVECASGRRLVLQVRAGEAVASPLASHGAPSARVFSARVTSARAFRPRL